MKIKLLLFLILAALQLTVPATMMARRELALHHGEQYRFRTAPVDPYDPFRGRYVTLRMKEGNVPLPEGIKLKRRQTVYAVVETDDDGFARIKRIRLDYQGGSDSFKVRVAYIGKEEVRLALPFDRYYAEESRASAIERAYWRHSRSDKRDAFVLVRIRQGVAVIEDLYVEGMPVDEYLRQETQKKGQRGG